MVLVCFIAAMHCVIDRGARIRREAKLVAIQLYGHCQAVVERRTDSSNYTSRFGVRNYRNGSGLVSSRRKTTLIPAQRF
jgi:hypothetical protein